MAPWLLFSLALAPAIDAPGARLLTNVVVAGASAGGRVDVISSDDVRSAVELEAQRQLAGCDSDSCLAEIAAAMGAAVVLHGSIGPLGDELILTLNLFDSNNGMSAGRELVRGTDIGALSRAAEQASQRLIDRAAQAAGDKRLRVIVMDLAIEQEEPEPPIALPWWWIAAGSVGVAGVASVVGGAYFDSEAVSAHDNALAAANDDEYAAFRDDYVNNGVVSVALYGAGVVLVGSAVALGVVAVGE